MSILESSGWVDYTVGRYITYEGMEQPTLWLSHSMDMSEPEAQRMARGRNKERLAKPEEYDSPESPFFVVKITRTEKLERVDDPN